MKFTLPVPPSANAYWRVFHNRVLLSAEARRYKTTARFKLLQQGELPRPLDGPVVVHLVVYRKERRGDLDNFQKCLLDSLKGLAFWDDAQVVEIHARREDDAESPRVEVRVEPEGVQNPEGGRP